MAASCCAFGGKNTVLASDQKAENILLYLLSRTDSIITAMRRATPTLTLPADAFSFSHLPPGAGTWVGGTGGPNDVEKVRVQYAWTPLTPVLRPFLTDGQIVVVVDSAMKNEGRFE